jgi:hypothetical protein
MLFLVNEAEIVGAEMKPFTGEGNQTWQVENKTCQVKLKTRYDCAFDLPGLVLTWQVLF